MGFTDHKLVAKFINGGLPPSSAISDPQLPPYQAEASQPPLLRSDDLQKTGIYLNLPTQGEREEVARLERERRVRLEREGGGGDGPLMKVRRGVDRVLEFAARGG